VDVNLEAEVKQNSRIFFKAVRVKLISLFRLQKRNIIIFLILVLAARAFFIYPDRNAQADWEGLKKNQSISPETLDPMKRIDNEKIPSSSIFIKQQEVCSGKKEDNDDNQDRLKIEKARILVSGYPIEAMLSSIYGREDKTALFLISIAKKESNWGRYGLKNNGKDCYNYWGYKGSYNLVRGYSCFDSPEQAVKIVGDKIDSLVDKQIDTPSKMIVWKCGSSCSGHDPTDVRKWISDVDLYYKKLDS